MVIDDAEDVVVVVGVEVLDVVVVVGVVVEFVVVVVIEDTEDVVVVEEIVVIVVVVIDVVVGFVVGVVVVVVVIVVSFPGLNNKNGMTAAVSVITVTTNVNILFEISLIISFFLFFSRMIDDCYFDGVFFTLLVILQKGIFMKHYWPIFSHLL